MNEDQADATRRFREAMRDVADAHQRAADAADALHPERTYVPADGSGKVDDRYLAFTHRDVLRERAAEYAPYLKTKTAADDVMRDEVARRNR
jgi:hypothetical protein